MWSYDTAVRVMQNSNDGNVRCSHVNQHNYLAVDSVCSVQIIPKPTVRYMLSQFWYLFLITGFANIHLNFILQSLYMNTMLDILVLRFPLLYILQCKTCHI
jgi:hypothetical protein